jgi:hypothetical protein
VVRGECRSEKAEREDVACNGSIPLPQSNGEPSSAEKQKLVQRYKDALPQISSDSQFKVEFITENPLQDLAWELLGSNPQAYNQNPSAPERDPDLTTIWQRRA